MRGLKGDAKNPIQGALTTAIGAGSAEGLMGDHDSRHQLGSGGFTIKILYKPVDRTENFGKDQPGGFGEYIGEPVCR